MTTKHTPGPWVVHSKGIDAKGSDFSQPRHGGKTCQECGHDESECYDTRIIFSLSARLIDDIKDGLWDDYDDSEQTSDADLRLIAAAPELLEALQRFVERDPHDNELTRLARAAISKATGA
jgi:hypothetical protein